MAGSADEVARLLCRRPYQRGAGPCRRAPRRRPGGAPELIKALRLRPLMTYAHPHWAVQLRIALIRVHFVLSDLAGARTLMVKIEEILKRRPDLGTLAGEADALRARLAGERGLAVPGASALTAVQLRLLPLLSSHLSFPGSPPSCSCRRRPSSRG